MDSDLALIIGLGLVALSIPSAVSAYSDARPQRASAVTFLIGGALVLAALVTHPGGYGIAEVPDVFFSVVARYIP